MRLIDLDELMKFPIRLANYDKEHGDENYVLGIEAVLEYAQYLPVIDAEPVKHGRWISLFGWYNRGVVKCSACGNTLDMNGVNAGRGDANLCPNCGAKMDLRTPTEVELDIVDSVMMGDDG